MRLSSSFAVFRADPSEQNLTRARWLAREGKVEAAEQEYRAVLADHPDVSAGWIELVELLRRDGRHQVALDVARKAEEHFGPRAAMPLVLRGAALSEMGRTREAVEALEAALERDGNLALAWHELAYAAFRVGELSRALLALDRAFALEPHVDTLLLRGRILREAGQYEAAEVAFDAAQQATDHDIPRRDAEREIQCTRRAAALGERRPATFSAREKIFVETGSAVLDAGPAKGGVDVELLAACLSALPQLVRAAGWSPGMVAPATEQDGVVAERIAMVLGVEIGVAAALDGADRPLIVTALNDGGADWSKHVRRLERWKSGHTFALVQLPGAADAADVVGAIRTVAPDTVLRATRQAAGSRPLAPLEVAEAARLAVNPQSPWKKRTGEA